jgi:F0F1-type ATP synthase membrane subunit b/b'
MPQLDISTYLPQVFWAAVLFALMFGMFVGFILPKMANILRHRKDFNLSTESKIDSLKNQNLELANSYQDKKDQLYQELQCDIDKSLQAIKSLHDKKIIALEQEMTDQLQQLQSSFENQLLHFDENYKDLIKESVQITLKKIGFQNGR